jgi:very-short-patch-repair endonuclease
MNNVMTRFDEAAKHYKQYRTEILEAGRSEWGVDPYEWECFSKMSPIESDLWRCIRAVDAVLYPQFPIGRYFADFCNPVAGVVIECDGAMWHQDAEKDAKRQNAIEGEGFTVYRITGKQCQDETFASAFVQDIAFRHDIVRGCRDCCVAWDFHEKRYVVASRDDLKNVNAGKAIDQEPGIAIVRDRLHTQEAWRIAKALNLTTAKAR